MGAGPKLVAQGVAAGAGGAGFVDEGLTTFGLAGIAAFALAAGFAEEPGWRGVALDDLQQSWSPLLAGLVIGVAWAVWHVPLYFIDGTFHHDLGFASSGFWRISLSLLPLSVLLAWMVHSTQGAIRVAALSHALGNISGEVLADDTTARVIELVVLVLAAVLVAAIGQLARLRNTAAVRAGS